MKTSLPAISLAAAIQGCSAAATDTRVDASMIDAADSMVVDGQVDAGNQDFRPLDVQRPFDASLRRELRLLLSGSNARPGSTVTAVAYVSDRGRIVPIDEIRLAMDGGDASLGRIGERGYDRANDVPSSLIMDKVCYSNQGDTGNLYSSLLLPTSTHSRFGTVRIVNAGQPCPQQFADSGLRTAKVYISQSMRSGAFKDLSATAISESDQPQASESIHVIDTTGGDLTTIATRVSSEIVMPGGETILMIAARDSNGFGLGCTSTPPESDFYDATSTNREPVATDTNGCTIERNSFALPIEDTITINTSHIAPGTRGYITLFSGTATGLQLFARGRGRTDADDDWSLHALGNGMYILPMRAANVRDRGEVQIWSGNPSNMEVGLIQVHIAN